ncbi:MAG: ABC transporter substrate-binding protein [Anaerolineae bacterium]
MFKKSLFIFAAFIFLAFLVGCEPESVEVEVTREVPVEIEVEVTREIPVEVEVERLVIVTPAAGVPAPVVVTDGGAESEIDPELEAADLPTVLRVPHSVIWSGEESLDPYEPTRFAEYSLLAYERLIRLDSAGNLVPGLATVWEANGDATVWTLTLRDGVLFHDGSEMGPADVAYSIERMIAPNTGSTLAPVLQSIAAVAVEGDSQITIGLSAPNIEFPLLLTDPRAVVLRNNGGDTILQDGIGTGPFKLDSVDTLGITELSAFAGYWGGQSSIDQVAIIGIPDVESRVQAMLAGQIDMLDRIEGDEKSLFEGSNEFSLQSVPTGNWRGFVMRTDTAPFDNPAVRQALRVVADRQGLIDSVLGGAGAVACDHPVWRGDRYWTEISCPQDVELAKSLLADAGFPDGIAVDLYTSAVDPVWPALIDAYQAQAQAAGITINIVEEPVETFWTDTWLIDPFVTTSWNARPAPLILNEAWRSSAPWNETYWNSSEFDALLDSAAAEPNLAVRKDQYAQAQTILWESGGAFIPFHLNQTRVVSTCIAGVLPTAAEHIDFSLIVKTPNCN